MKKLMFLVALLAIVGSVNAGTTISSNITGQETWTKANSPYHLQGVIYVMPGASLTVEAGVVVASYVSGEGSLAITQGADLFINGTAAEPVIFTSANDVATWDGSDVTIDGNGVVVGLPGGTGNVTAINVMGDPKTGTWRPVCTEWGSIAVLGKGYISASHYGNNEVEWTDNNGTPHTNSKCPDAMNKKQMEGLTAAAGEVENILYGGDDDDDDSGSISYLSCRYGGNDAEFAKELNGISLGALGRGTDIHHIEIMNNVDDGIEIWGGTVQLDHVTVWNIGDDSIDCDEGWRGSVDTGLIVQGYSQEAKQGSGMGDNAFETDGAEDCDAQPMTTVAISNITVVGQPAEGIADTEFPFTQYTDGSDGGTTWRDNARVQYDNCIWMDLDDQIILFDNADKDGAQGYDGTASKDDSGDKSRTTTDDGTLSWVDHWTTSFNTWKVGASADPRGCGINFATLYEAYVATDLNANLCDITNSVFWGKNIKFGEYDQLVLDGANLSGNTKLDQVAGDPMPIQNLVRGAAVKFSADGKNHGVEPVEFINPLPAAGITAGGFSNINWLASWTAADAYGMTDTSMNAANGDVNVDGSVDLADFMVLSDNWLQ